jgi:UPF0716 protein FxsA
MMKADARRRRRGSPEKKDPMRLQGLVPLLILAWPILEIVVFIVVGGAIGILPTVLLVIAGVVLGAVLLRVSGLALLSRLRTDVASGHAPERAMVSGAMTAIAGVLLIVPGFVSDAVALLLLLPPVQNALAARLAGGITIVGADVRPAPPDGVDLDPDDFARKPDPSSPWRDGNEPPMVGRG